MNNLKEKWIAHLLTAYSLTLCFAVAVYGDTHTAASLSEADVQYAINASTDGDTVLLPPGTRTWTECVKIIDKGITLKGAGEGQTTIIDGTPGNFVYDNKPLYIAGAEGKPFRVTGLTFSGKDANGGYPHFMGIVGDCKAWRVDHCRFNECQIPIRIDGLTYGLIDHCTFYLNDFGAAFGAVWIIGGDDSLWDNPPSPGTANAVYLEDNVWDSNFHHSDLPAILTYQGATSVFRHNISNAFVEIHGACTGGYRGALYSEIYDNVFYHKYAWLAVTIWGSAGVIFNNTMTGEFSSDPPIVFVNYRTCRDNCPAPTDGRCTGTDPKDGNLAIDSDAHTGGNNQSTLTCTGKNWTDNQWAGYAAWNITDNSRGIITANTNNTITVTLGNGTRNLWNTGDSFKITNGYPCLDQVGRSGGFEVVDGQTVQKAEPYYLWNNKYNGSLVGARIEPGWNCSEPSQLDHIREGRDWYNCTSLSDAQSKGLNYTPYQYPHPLQQILGDVVDTSSPTVPGPVSDGTGTDIDSTGSATQLSANWTAATDSDSGIANYQYAIGTSPGATNTTNGWLNNSTNLTVTKTGLTLAVATTYYFTVRAINGYGLIGSSANSDGQSVVIDGTQPAAPAQVRDGTGTDISTTILLTQLSANWDAATDTESGISGYKYAIGTSPGSTDALGWTTLGNVTTVTKTGLTLVVGTTYYFSVKAVNGASSSLESNATNSNGQYVREVSTESVYLSDLTWASSTNGWGPVEKNLSNGEDSAGDGTTITLNTVTYAKGLGTHANSEIVYTLNGQYETFECVVGVDDEAGTNGSVTFEVWVDNVKQFDSGIMSGTSASQTVNVDVRGADTLKLVITNGGNGNGYDHGDWADAKLTVGSVTTDTTPPTAPAQVRDGTGTDISSTTSTIQLSANWNASTDSESEISNYEYAIGTSPGATNITNAWISNGTNLTVTKTGLMLLVGQTYYFSVRAQSEGGIGLAANSDGQLVYDPTNPAPLITGVTSVNPNTNSVTITWTTDKPATSQVEYGVTTVYGQQSTVDSGLVTSHSVTIAGLTEGTTYHYRVKSDDGSDHNGVGVDNTFVTGRSIIHTPQPGIYAYPNPCDFKEGRVMKFVIRNSETGEVRIYTMNGKLVTELKGVSGTGEIIWDGMNENGEKVTRGIYIYRLTETNGDSVTGKLAVTR